MIENFMTLIRLNKHIAELGYCSRRKADELIKDGKVKINGKITKALGIKVNPKKDRIKLPITNYKLPPNKSLIYLALNKPTGYISSTTSKTRKKYCGN